MFRFSRYGIERFYTYEESLIIINQLHNNQWLTAYQFLRFAQLEGGVGSQVFILGLEIERTN